MTGAFVFTGALAANGAGLSPTGDSEGYAQVLGADLLASSLAATGTAHAIYPDGPATKVDPLDVAALDGALSLDLGNGISLPLIGTDTVPGLLDLGQLGAVQSYAKADAPNHSVAASGLVGDDGTIAISDQDDPSDLGNAKVNLTSLLDQLDVSGLTDNIVDQLSLQIGAVASRAEQTNGSAATSEYKIADLKANIHSALVAQLSTAVKGSVDGVASKLSDSINGLVGTGSTLQGVVDAVPDIDLLGVVTASLGDPTVAVNVPDLSTVVDDALSANGGIVVSDDQSVTIDLTNGTITVDLAKIVSPSGLNGLDKNTDVLTADTLTKITDGVSNALGKIIGPLTTAVQTALDGTTATVSVNVTAATVGATIIDAPITISGTLQQLANGTGTVDTSQIKLLPGVNTCLGTVVAGACIGVDISDIASMLVGTLTGDLITPLVGALGTAVSGILTATSTQITDALSGVLSTTLSALDPVLSGVLNQIVQIRINDQPTPGDLGADSFTVRALSLTLLPGVAGSSLAKVSLASSTVRTSEVADVNITKPADGTSFAVAADDDTTSVEVAGTGQPGATVVVALNDGSSKTTTVDDSGHWTVTFPEVPVGDYTATATQTAGTDTSTDDTTFSVEVSATTTSTSTTDSTGTTSTSTTDSTGTTSTSTTDSTSTTPGTSTSTTDSTSTTPGTSTSTTDSTSTTPGTSTSTTDSTGTTSTSTSTSTSTTDSTSTTPGTSTSTTDSTGTTSTSTSTTDSTSTTPGTSTSTSTTPGTSTSTTDSTSTTPGTSTSTSTSTGTTSTSTSTTDSTSTTPGTSTSTSTTDSTSTSTTAGPSSSVKYKSIVRGTGVVQEIYGTGFQPGESVTGTLHSTPTALGAKTADASGNVSWTVAIDSSFELGAHSADLTGSVSGAVPSANNHTQFTVTAAAATTTGGSGNGGLASTGSNTDWALPLLMVLFLAGGGALLVARRKRAAQQ